MKKVMIAAVMAMTVLIANQEVEAKEETEEERIEAEIVFQLTVEDRYPYEIRVSKGGSVYDGRQRITNGIQEYQLSVGEEKTFRIKADKGYRVERIVINGENIEKKIERVMIIGVSARSILEVRFKKEEETSVLDPPSIEVEEEKEERGIVITGDKMKVYGYIVIMLLIGYGLYEDRRQKEMEILEKEGGRKI